MNTQKHYFLAVKLPETIKNEFALYTEKIKDELPFRRWVHREDLHITLAFLGYATEEQLHNISKIMPSIAKKYEALSLKLTTLNTFGKKESPRILWYGIEDNSDLYALRQDIFLECERLGFSLDKRPFHPHITLARQWKGGNFCEELLIPFHTMNSLFLASGFVLYQTNLQSVPKYEIIHSYTFKEE